MAEMGHQLQLVGVTWLEDAMTERFVRAEESSEEAERRRRDGERCAQRGGEREDVSGAGAASRGGGVRQRGTAPVLNALRSQAENPLSIIHMQIATYSSMQLRADKSMRYRAASRGPELRTCVHRAADAEGQDAPIRTRWTSVSALKRIQFCTFIFSLLCMNSETGSGTKFLWSRRVKLNSTP